MANGFHHTVTVTQLYEFLWVRGLCTLIIPRNGSSAREGATPLNVQRVGQTISSFFDVLIHAFCKEVAILGVSQQYS